MKGTRNTWFGLLVTLLAGGAVMSALPALAQTDGAAAGSATPEDAAATAAAEAAAAETAAQAAAAEAAAAEAAAAEAAAEAARAEAARAEAAAAEAADADSSSALASGSGEAPEEEEEIDRARSEEEAEAAQEAAEPLSWRNSFFSWTMGSTFNTFYRGADLSYNPLYYWSFFLTPRWYFSSNVFLVVNQGAYYEFTDDDSATYNHEIQLYDTTMEIRATFVADRFIFIPAIRLTIPVSKLSQAAQRYFNTGIGLTAVANLPEVANGNLALSLAYRRWWGDSNVPLTSGLIPQNTANGNVAGSNGSEALGDGQSDGTALSVDRLLLGLTWNVTPVEGLTLTLSGFLIWDQGYRVAAPTLGFMGNPSGEVVGDDRGHWRMFSSYSFQAAYDVATWFNLAIGVSNATNLSPFWASDGSILSPFNPNTQVFLSGTVTLDGIYETLFAPGEDDNLTPEERQRRRQGLAALDEEVIEDMVRISIDDEEDSAADDESATTGAARTTGTF